MSIHVKTASGASEVGKRYIKTSSGVDEVSKVFVKTSSSADEIWSSAEQVSLVPETDASKRALWSVGNGYRWSGNYVGTYYNSINYGYANSYRFELTSDHKQIRVSVSIAGATNMTVALKNSAGTTVWSVNFTASGGGTYALPANLSGQYYLSLSTNWMWTDRFAQLTDADILVG